MTMANDRAWLSVLLFAALVLLLGAAAAIPAAAEDAAPPSGQSGGDRAGEHQTESKGSGETESKGAPQGEDPSGGKHGIVWGPIDTSITVVSAPRSLRSSKSFGWKKSKLVRRSGGSHDHRQIETHHVKDLLVRNPIGLSVHQSGAVGKRTSGQTITPTPIGGAPQSPSPPGGGTGLHGQHFVPVQAGGKKPDTAPVTTAINPMVINGTGIGRLAWHTGAVGGAAKTASGVLNGTGFRPRHP
jgi:hypothetical protein